MKTKRVPMMIVIFLLAALIFTLPANPASAQEGAPLPEGLIQAVDSQQPLQQLDTGTDTVATQYTFSQSTLTYTEIVSGTVHGTASNDDQNFQAIDLGFTLSYNGVEYTQISIQNNGWIAMGPVIASSYYPLSTSTYNNVISAFGRDLQGNGSTSQLMSKTEGSAPNRVFTVQWKAYKRYGTSYVGDSFNFQIKLHETSNLIEVVYGPFTVLFVAAPPAGPQVGLRGDSNADFNNRTLDAAQLWAASIAGTTNADIMTLNDLVYPGNGLTYQWTPTPGVFVGPLSQAGIACPGSDTFYNITVVNQTGAAQSFNLSYTSVWPASGPAATGIIPNFGSETVLVSVHVPWSAVEWQSDTLTAHVADGSGTYTADATATTTAALFESYTDLANLPLGREVRGASSVYYDGKIYKIGGYGYIGSTGAARAWVDIYDVASNTWSAGADMPGARYWIDCEEIGAKIYCAGGYLSAGTNTLYIYDIATNTWTTGATLPANRYDYDSVKHAGKYYVIGGYTTTNTATMVVYDPVANTWDSTLPSMAIARRYGHAGVINGKIYYAGGYSSTYFSTMEVLDLAAPTAWTAGPSMPIPLVNAADGVVNDRYLLLTGGSWSSTSGASNAALVYDAVLNQWSWLPLIDRLLYSAEGDSDGVHFWTVSGRMYENAVWLNSPYTFILNECAACVPVTTADFTVNPATPRPALPATFTGTADGTSAAFTWDFGDMGTGSGQVIDHTFAAIGTYNVSMTASTCDGANQVVVAHPVVVEAGPLASISPLSLEATQCPDCQTTQQVEICNGGGQALTWAITETVGDIISGYPISPDSLSGSYVVFDPGAGGDEAYYPGTPGTFCFRTETWTTDWEYRYGEWLKFPADWSVDSISVVGEPVCDSGGTWDTFSWFFENTPYEVGIDHAAYQETADHCVATYCVAATPGPLPAGDVGVSWYYDGDGFNNAPHHPCSSDNYTPASMSVTDPCDEAINPLALIPIADASPIRWLSESPTSGTVAVDTCDLVDITFDSEEMDPGTYTGTLVVLTNDTMNLRTDIPVTMTVAGPPTNLGFTYTPAQPNMFEEVEFSGFADSLTPVTYAWDFGDEITGTGQTASHAYADYGDYIVTMTVLGCGEPLVYTETVTVAPCQSLVVEDFEGSFPPAGWTVVDSPDSDCSWQRNDFFAVDRPNYAGGVGFAADADSDKCGSGTTMDTELRTFLVDLSTMSTAELTYVTSYNDIGTGGDLADVDASSDGGLTWTNLLHWDADHSPSGPGEPVTIDLSAFAGYSQVMVRFHYYIATYDWWWEIDQVKLTACMVPDAVPNIDVTPTVMTQTLRTNETAVQTLAIDNLGYTWLSWALGDSATWLSEDPLSGLTHWAQGPSLVDVMFDSNGLSLGTYSTSINIASDDPDEPVVSVGVTLIVTGTPDISVTPAALDQTLYPNTTASQNLQICNVGDGDLTWDLVEAPETMILVPDRALPAVPSSPNRPVITSPEQCALYENYTGLEPLGAAEFCDAPAVPAVLPAGLLAPTQSGYAQDIGYISDNFVTFTLNDFTGQTVMGTNTNAYYGMDFDPSGTILYALNDTTDQLGTINLANGAFTPLVSCPPGGGEANWTGLSIDPVSGVFYGSTATSLFTIDPATGSATLVGPFGTTLMIDIAVNAAGLMYGHDIGTDSIYSINPATGAATLIGLTGYLANYAQGMDFDNDDGTLYIFLYIGSGANVYGTVNLTTGAVTPLAADAPLGEFEGATATFALTDIPWLSENPTSGTVLPGECTNVTVTFDSTGLAPASYYGNLEISSDDPDEPEVVVPITLIVETVADLGVTKVDDPDPVLLGHLLQYTITVENFGPYFSNSSTVVDNLPDGFDFVSASPSCAFVPGTLTCDIGYLGMGETAVITVTGTAVETGTLINTVAVTGDDFDPVAANNTATADTDVIGYLVTFTYNDLEDVVAVGERVWIRGDMFGWNNPITMTANLDYSVFSVTIEVAPGTYEYKYFMPDLPDWWNYDELNTQNRSITITSAMSVVDYRNVEVGWANLNEPTDVTIILGQSSGPLYGEVYIQNVTAGAGEGRAVSAQLGITSDGVTWDWSDMTYSSDNIDNDIFTAEVTPLAVGVYTYTVRFDGNQGIGNPNAGWTLASNSGQLTVLPVYTPTADLSLTVTDTPDPVVVNRAILYTFTVSNAGPDDAENSVLAVTLDPAVTFASASAGCTEVSGIVTCDLGTIASGGQAVVTVTVTAPNHGGTVTSTAEVSSTTEDPDLANNTASANTLVQFKFFLPIVMKQ